MKGNPLGECLVKPSKTNKRSLPWWCHETAWICNELNLCTADGKPKNQKLYCNWKQKSQFLLSNSALEVRCPCSLTRTNLLDTTSEQMQKTTNRSFSWHFLWNRPLPLQSYHKRRNHRTKTFHIVLFWQTSRIFVMWCWFHSGASYFFLSLFTSHLPLSVNWGE